MRKAESEGHQPDTEQAGHTKGARGKSHKSRGGTQINRKELVGNKPELSTEHL